MIEVKNLTKVYGKGESKFTALDDVSFLLEEGSSVAIVGKSGSGKSTLMHIMSGLDRPTKGCVEVAGKDLSAMGNSEIDNFRNKEIGFIFQTFYMQPNETVLENVMLPVEIEGLSSTERKEAAKEALKRVELLDKLENSAKDLSGGQKQRVCIARAIVSKPKIIFADEPTGNLDSSTGKKIINLLFELNKDLGCTLVIVTHDEDLASKCEKIIQLKDGKVVTS